MLVAIDPPLFHWLNAGIHSPGWYLVAARWVSTWLPGICGTLLAAWMAQHGSAGRRSLCQTMAALALAWMAAKLIRWGFPQPRPAALGMGMQWIGHRPDPSLPSLHTAGAYALAQSVQLGWTRHQRWLPPLIWSMALLVALSRVVLGVHFPTDVLAGMAVGCTSAWLVWHGTAWAAHWRHPGYRAAHRARLPS